MRLLPTPFLFSPSGLEVIISDNGNREIQTTNTVNTAKSRLGNEKLVHAFGLFSCAAERPCRAYMTWTREEAYIVIILGPGRSISVGRHVNRQTWQYKPDPTDLSTMAAPHHAGRARPDARRNDNGRSGRIG